MAKKNVQKEYAAALKALADAERAAVASLVGPRDRYQKAHAALNESLMKDDSGADAASDEE